MNTFYEMQMGVKPDNCAFACILSLCTKEIKDLGNQVHSLVIKAGYLSKTSMINLLITMYFSIENLDGAYEDFEETEAK
ncbi:unnamed protein product, partial [Citrullus colocynthis]